ncbi:MAG TPA: hypothetical protein VIJ16_03980 [Gemmatimonadaceae bacterium]
MTSLYTITIACALAVASAAQGQGSKSGGQTVPPDLRPPVGMCRVWVNGVPAGRQPAPTDCASALRNLPSNGRVIFGDDYKNSDSASHRMDNRGGELTLKGVAPMPKGMEQRADSTANRKPEEDRKRLEMHKPGGRKPDSTSRALWMPRRRFR